MKSLENFLARREALGPVDPHAGPVFSEVPDEASGKCAHVNTHTLSEPVRVQVGTRGEIGAREFTYRRHYEACRDCGDVLLIPTPGLVVDEYLAVITDEGENAGNARRLEMHMDGGLMRLDSAVCRLMAKETI